MKRKIGILEVERAPGKQGGYTYALLKKPIKHWLLLRPPLKSLNRPQRRKAKKSGSSEQVTLKCNKLISFLYIPERDVYCLINP